MQIVELLVERLKRIKAVQIIPKGPVVQITGRNAQGKSSVLDAIEYALGGKGCQPQRPVRDGALLDAESMAALAELAEQHSVQLWLERVSDGQPVGIVIEDGEVANNTATVAA